MESSLGSTCSKLGFTCKAPASLIAATRRLDDIETWEVMRVAWPYPQGCYNQFALEHSYAAAPTWNMDEVSLAIVSTALIACSIAASADAP